MSILVLQGQSTWSVMMAQAHLIILYMVSTMLHAKPPPTLTSPPAITPSQSTAFTAILTQETSQYCSHYMWITFN